MRGLLTIRTTAILSLAILEAGIFPSLARSESENTGAPPGRRLLLFAPAGALLIQANIDTGSRSVEQIRQEYASQLFAQLDVDQSGNLNAEERAAIPALRRAGGLPPDQALQPYLENGQLNAEGLAKYVDSQLGPTFEVVARAPRLDQTVRLMDLLDQNRDSVISLDEVLNGATALRAFDLDDDEAISVTELQPFPQSIRQAQRQEAAETKRKELVLDLTAPGASAAAVPRVLAAYSEGQSAVSLKAGGLGTISARFDEDGDGALQADELERWLEKAPCDVVLNVRIPDSGATRVAATHEDSDRLKPTAKPSFRRWEVEVDGAELKADALNNRSMALDSQRLAKIRFLQSDADNNDYLDEQEYQGLQFTAPFAMVDANGDGMVRADEVEKYARTLAQLSQTRLILTVADDVTSLYQLMDGDSNNRLTTRELLSLAERLAPQDRNSNGQFDTSDFISKYRLTFSFGKPEGFDAPPMAMAMDRSSRRPAAPRIGPLWFQKMDRNRDKDVSWREFLGPRATFDRIDLNGDGLIDKDEAEAATSGEAVTAAGDR